MASKANQVSNAESNENVHFNVRYDKILRYTEINKYEEKH